ncbi:YdcF family protein [Marinoscillum sp. MHG1-6]|uniref:YdcF family protein n=1 Tax=Marinoscillum sp. MHG1-6 TaxID=2959627 RepID=UPI002157D41B|nr:YdcF family protein [Marinoscillum sp. MHG1-6]
MFFYLSKVLGILIDPFLWILVGLIYGLWNKKTNKPRFILPASLILLVLFSNPFLSNYAMRQWEFPPINKADLPYTDIGIVLTGMAHPDFIPEDQIHFSEGADRITEAITLYHDGLIARVLVTGGISVIKKERTPESEALLPLLHASKIEQSDLFIEKQARNSYENARFTKDFLVHENLQDRRALLITSAYHMKRAMACFKKQGLDVIAYPVDYRSGPVDFDIQWILPSAIALNNWRILFKEWVGYVTYKLLGYA